MAQKHESGCKNFGAPGSYCYCDCPWESPNELRDRLLRKAQEIMQASVDKGVGHEPAPYPLIFDAPKMPFNYTNIQHLIDTHREMLTALSYIRRYVATEAVNHTYLDAVINRATNATK